ncbi:CGNR zinc finger domain-containing protein [Sphingobium aromaticiconvertens]|uniref:CGNR zinc finger domain-containing protein n=1 Tax=Sphingobium aromaticiconvertens TaxID=365341 RepID=UPI003AFA0EAC
MARADPGCRWIFLDRSKPGSRRWCSSTGCGNRQKTRASRARRSRGDPASISDDETRCPAFGASLRTANLREIG